MPFQPVHTHNSLLLAYVQQKQRREIVNAASHALNGRECSQAFTCHQPLHGSVNCLTLHTSCRPKKGHWEHRSKPGQRHADLKLLPPIPLTTHT